MMLKSDYDMDLGEQSSDSSYLHSDWEYEIEAKKPTDNTSELEHEFFVVHNFAFDVTEFNDVNK